MKRNSKTEMCPSRYGKTFSWYIPPAKKAYKVESDLISLIGIYVKLCSVLQSLPFICCYGQRGQRACVRLFAICAALRSYAWPLHSILLHIYCDLYNIRVHDTNVVRRGQMVVLYIPCF